MTIYKLYESEGSIYYRDESKGFTLYCWNAIKDEWIEVTPTTDEVIKKMQNNLKFTYTKKSMHTLSPIDGRILEI